MLNAVNEVPLSNAPAVAPAQVPETVADRAHDRRRALADWYLSGWHRGLWCLGLTPGLLVLAALVVAHGNMTHLAARHADSLAEIQKLVPPDIPYEQNAARLYAEAFDLAATKPTESMDLLHKAAAMEDCKFSLNYSKGFGMLLLHLSKFKNAARSLGASAETCAGLGDHARAAKHLRATCQMARHVEADPILINSLVATAMRGTALEHLQSILLDNPHLTHEALQGYREALVPDADPQGSLIQMLTGEKWLGMLSLSGMPVESDLYASMFSSTPDRNLTIFTMPDDLKLYERLADIHLQSVRDDRPLNSEQLEALIAAAPGSRLTTTAPILPILGRAHVSKYRAAEKARAADAALAIMQYRLKHGRNPNDLAELVPEHLRAVPHGVFNAAPLRMLLLDDGILMENPQNKDEPVSKYQGAIRVYSLGEDGVDDKGLHTADGIRGQHVTWQLKTDDDFFVAPPMITGQESAEPEKAGEGRP